MDLFVVFRSEGHQDPKLRCSLRETYVKQLLLAGVMQYVVYHSGCIVKTDFMPAVQEKEALSECYSNRKLRKSLHRSRALRDRRKEETRI